MRLLQKRIIKDFKGNPYLVRYTLFSCRWFGIFLHKILRSDSDRDLHDHPWSFTTILLAGQYCEDQPADNPPMFDARGQMYTKPRICKRGTIIHHKATDAHCLSLPTSYEPKHGLYVQEFIPVWSLFIHGPRTRNWGFHTGSGWVDWETYVKRNRDTDTSPMED